jgi:hypothetical protein
MEWALKGTDAMNANANALVGDMHVSSALVCVLHAVGTPRTLYIKGNAHDDRKHGEADRHCV